ncbi:ATP-binding cassette domain-containing protein [uncultured Propionibacterium sp.]|uniref:ATP-binding cassette domain-containing protein n=1 Tax=uncultured Propionibacterium sp. TaxID=218066 RepID=UPI0037DCDF74
MAMRLVDATKRYRGVPVLAGVSFTAEDGRISCSVGPNGAGKSSAIRAMCGLLVLDGGSALVDEAPLPRHPCPLRSPGVVLGPEYWVGSRTGYRSLLGLALSDGITASRVRECLKGTGIADVADRRAATCPLGMRQRLSSAAALLGDPRNLILDEPLNGLDPKGVRWLRGLLCEQAGRGRPVLRRPAALAYLIELHRHHPMPAQAPRPGHPLTGRQARFAGQQAVDRTGPRRAVTTQTRRKPTPSWLNSSTRCTTCARPSARSSSSTTSRCPSSRMRRSASWAPTAPASPPS